MPREGTTRPDPAESSPGRPNSLGIHQRQLDSLLERVDHASNSMLAPKRPRYVRWPFRQETILIKISHPSGTTAAVKVASSMTPRMGGRGGVGNAPTLATVKGMKMGGGVTAPRGTNGTFHSAGLHARMRRSAPHAMTVLVN